MQGWRDQGNTQEGGLGKDGKKTDHPSLPTCCPVNISLVRNMLSRTTPSGKDYQ